MWATSASGPLSNTRAPSPSKPHPDRAGIAVSASVATRCWSVPSDDRPSPAGDVIDLIDPMWKSPCHGLPAFRPHNYGRLRCREVRNEGLGGFRLRGGGTDAGREDKIVLQLGRKLADQIHVAGE